MRVPHPSRGFSLEGGDFDSVHTPNTLDHIAKTPMDLVFCGTPSFAVPTLEKLILSGHRINLVVTQPDRPKGRGLERVASPVKQSALDLICQSPNPPASRPMKNSVRNSPR